MYIVQSQRILLILLTLVTMFIVPHEGQLDNETHAKIVGGRDIMIYDAPYQVSIRRRVAHLYKFGLGHVCGGTLISQRMVCTAAHCFAMWVESILYLCIFY